MPFHGAYLRLGDLLLEAKILTEQQIGRAVSLAQGNGLPVGRALVMIDALTEDELQAALQAQSLFRDGLMTKEQCLKAMRIVHLDGSSCEDAFKQLTATQEVETNRLGELLVAASIVKREDLPDLLSRSKESGLPLGCFLSSIGLVSESLVMMALTLQILIREGKLGRAEAIDRLNRACQKRVLPRRSGQVPSLKIFPGSKNILLGELLVKAGIIEQTELLKKTELALLEDRQLGSVLVSDSCITEALLEQALSVQKMVATGEIKPRLAIQAISLVHRKSIPLAEAITKAQASESKNGVAINLETFLGLAGVINTREIEEDLGNPLDCSFLCDQMLKTGKVSESFLRDCTRLHALVLSGMLTLERAVVVVRQCRSNGKSAMEQLQDLGWPLAV